MMIATTWCLYFALNIFYYTQKVSCEITMQDILQNFVYSLASHQLRGVSIPFKDRGFVSFDILQYQIGYTVDYYDNVYQTTDALLILEIFQDYLPDVIYCKYAERITVITHYIFYVMEECQLFINQDRIRTLNVFIQKLVEMVNSIQNGIHYVSQLGTREYSFPNIPYLFLINPLNSGPIEQSI
ncbi:uncharacterized protein LOC126907698 [Daktulosphaira vitifoliae]|uniref:uncharacterized protein LOC126907698 n=1 Tax=Daktulosphaira vitifoliae TaxID=58002 RepID=UPI0021AAE893|nr:uncharacterized protein LOC126907698 [Daktulosphaira vitifoliae]